MDYEGLKNHINFINQLWKKNIDITSFTPIGDYYYVVIAGHTRLDGIKDIAKKKNCEAKVTVKLHNVKTSEEILAIQLDENIHSEPRLEERAIAIIETYRLGIMNGKWHDQDDFIKQNKSKFSRRVLNDALVFSNLPLEVQEYIYSKNIPFAVGVELGRIYPLVEKEEIGYVESNISLEQNIGYHYARLLIKLQQAKSVK
jgi:hypothetical protein